MLQPRHCSLRPFRARQTHESCTLGHMSYHTVKCEKTRTQIFFVAKEFLSFYRCGLYHNLVVTFLRGKEKEFGRHYTPWFRLVTSVILWNPQQLHLTIIKTCWFNNIRLKYVNCYKTIDIYNIFDAHKGTD